jgi:hypothetical protein
MKYNFQLFWRTFYRSFFDHKNTTARLTKKRLIFLLLFYIVWPLGGLIHWFCFWLDDILFPAYKNHPIEKPLFILRQLAQRIDLSAPPALTRFGNLHQPDHMGYLPDALGHAKEDHAIRFAAG